MISFLPADHFQSKGLEKPVSFQQLNRVFLDHFDADHGFITVSGRAAIEILLRSLKLTREDEVWVATTFDYPNVSSCVTCTIFNICKPSRVLTAQTKAILVIHEFGVVHPDLLKMRQLATDRGIPLIEDCAHTIDSQFKSGMVGRIADYVIVSFPKIFPVKSGGMLLGLKAKESSFDQNQKKELKGVASVVLDQWPLWPQQAQRRREIFKKLSSAAKGHGLRALFEVTDEITPWFFPLVTGKGEKFINSAMDCGIDCRPWYGSDVVILPCHQYLDDGDVKNISLLIKKGSR